MPDRCRTFGNSDCGREQPYFNAGVMLIDLDAWRREDLVGRMLACLRRHRRDVLWWDQYALNVELAGHWTAPLIRAGIKGLMFMNSPTGGIVRSTNVRLSASAVPRILFILRRR